MSSLLDHPEIRSALLPLTVEQYRRLGEAGLIDERTELLRGMVIRKTNKPPLHTWTVQKLKVLLEAQVPPGCILRKEDPVTLSTSEPEPDLAIVPGDVDDFRQSYPTTAALIVEVAIASESVDREKASIYAEANVQEYWLVLPVQQRLVRHFRPSTGRFDCVEELTFDDDLRSLAMPTIVVPLSKLKTVTP